MIEANDWLIVQIISIFYLILIQYERVHGQKTSENRKILVEFVSIILIYQLTNPFGGPHTKFPRLL